MENLCPLCRKAVEACTLAAMMLTPDQDDGDGPEVINPVAIASDLGWLCSPDGKRCIHQNKPAAVSR